MHAMGLATSKMRLPVLSFNAIERRLHGSGSAYRTLLAFELRWLCEVASLSKAIHWRAARARVRPLSLTERLGVDTVDTQPPL